MNTNTELINLTKFFKEFRDAEKIDRPTLMKIIEEVLKAMLKKKYGNESEANFDIIVNEERGFVEIYHRRLIVEDRKINDDVTQITISEAIAKDPDAGFEVGEEFSEKLSIDSFGRRAVLAAKQTLISRVNDLKKGDVIKKYTDLLGEIVSVEVFQVYSKEVCFIDEDGNDLTLPKDQQISQDFFKKGEIVKAIVHEINTTKKNTPLIYLSRTSNKFLEKLLEKEVPEIFDGLIHIKHIAREPGERAKVIVHSEDDRIDPIGACVGMKGSRIHGVVRELRNENIDVIQYTNNMNLLIQRALTPAKVSYINLDAEHKMADVFFKNADEVKLAIGRRGINIKLACKLLDYEIEVHREDEEEYFDFELTEFNDEIENWIIEEFRKVGCDTAKSVLDLSVDELERRTDLERETIIEVKKIIQLEFDKG